MGLINDMLKFVGECVSLLVLLVAFVIVKILYWAVMGIKFLVLLLSALC